ncbi:hypothetical protein AB0F91_40100 [Amycolatopsis sp. NPDC023774]|uniref:hypothetical protein n=1 Tax=Amycolatopsis sp. NPDC023774 TaxID=3155015 RepID=UPI0033DEA102
MAGQEDQHGWAEDIGTEGGAAAEGARKSREKPDHEPDPQRDYSPTGTLSDTDMEPGSPFGAGDSTTRRGEEIGPDPGEDAEGYKGASQRPYGSSHE